MSEKREVIEDIYKLIKDLDVKEFNDEDRVLRNLKSSLGKFNVKYDCLDKYGVELKVDNISHSECYSLSSNYASIYVTKIDGSENNYILNSKKQPKKEVLMAYSQNTGSYMFGGSYWNNEEYYDQELFNMYFDELKKYEYKYIDEMNNCIYFDLEVGFNLYKNYLSICKKYQKLFNDRMTNNEKENLKKRLEKIEELEMNINE